MRRRRGEAIDPRWLDLASMRAHGATEVNIVCGCGRCVTLNVDQLDGNIKVLAVWRHCRCSVCGERPISSTPNWPLHRPADWRGPA